MHPIEEYRKVANKFTTKKATYEFAKRFRKELGIKVNTSAKKIAVRNEKTPSAVAHKRLYFYDFGLGESVSLLYAIKELNNISYIEAAKRIISLYKGLPATWIVEQQKEVEVIVPKKPPYKESYITALQKDRLTNWKTFYSILNGLCRSCSKEEKKRAIEIFSIGFVKIEFTTEEGVEIKEDRLFIPERDVNGTPFNAYQYNRALDPKGRFRKNGKRVLFGAHLLKDFINKPIISAEGHSDCVVHNAKGMQSVSTGSASTPIGEEGLRALSRREIHLYPDMDDAGIKGALMKALEIELWNATHPDSYIKSKIVLWAKGFKNKKGNIITEGKIKEEAKAFLRKKWQDLSREEKAAAKLAVATLEKSKILSSKIVKEGYDGIDFHTDNQSHPAYEAWKKKYTSA